MSRSAPGRLPALFTHAQALFSFLVADVLKAEVVAVGPLLVGHVEFELAMEELPVHAFGRLDPASVHIAKTAGRSV